MSDHASSYGRDAHGGGGVSPVLRGCLIAAGAVLAFAVLLVFMVVGLIVLGAAAQVQRPHHPEPVRLREIHLSGPAKAPKIAVVNIEGMIYGSSQPTGRLTPVAIVSAKLDRARRDPEVKGVLLFVDSGGGGVTGADILHERLERLRTAEDPLPVVASILDIGFSGAYYAICGVDRIFAHPTSLTGSIGVMMPLFDATELMQKIGVREESIVSGEFKNIGSPLSEQPEELKQRQREILENIVHSMHERFAETVAAGRGLDIEDVAAIADGRIMTALEALEAGLIDEIGYEDDAIAALAGMMGVDAPRLVEYRREMTFGALFSSMLYSGGLDFLPFAERLRRLGSRPMYLWTGEDL